MSKWLELKLTVDKSLVEDIEAELEALGALSVTHSDAADQPILEPGVGELPLWDQVTVTGLFDGAIGAQHLNQRVQTQLGHANWSIAELADQDWTQTWRQGWQPQCYGDRLWIIPSDATEPAQGAVIRLDPGMAFGTGSHETTAMCLDWLAAQEQLTETRVLDFGCGSGILAIAAVKLGCREATGVDNDPQAITATLENARVNGVADQVFATSNAEGQQFDIVIANILANTLIQLYPEISHCCKPGARLAMSGILADQADAVEAVYAQGFRDFTRTQQGDWVLLTAIRNQ